MVMDVIPNKFRRKLKVNWHPIHHEHGDCACLKLDKILGAVHDSQQILFIIKRKKIDHPELVKADIMNRMFPREVITYYQNLYFKPDGKIM